MDGTLLRIRKTFQLRLLLLFVAALGSVQSPARAQGSQYTFTRIADTEQDNSGLEGPYCLGLNNQGTVIVNFVPEASQALQLWSGDGHSFTQIAPDVASICPSINDHGETAYIVANHQTGHVALVRNTNGTLTTLASSTSFPFIDGGTSSAYTPLNNQGSAAFVTLFVQGASVPGIRIQPAGIWAYNPDTDPQLLAFVGPASINDANTAVFLGIRADASAPFGSRVGIYRGSSIPLVEDGDLTSVGPIAVSFSTRPVINNAGTVAFIGSTTGVSTIYTTVDGVSLTVVGNAPIDRIAMNNSGTVAFRGSLGAMGEGIFVGRPGSIDEKVIEAGDPLDGSTYLGGFLWEESINDNGQVAFYAFLADGRRGVYRADPVDIADTSAPVISGVPANIVAEGTSAAGAAVGYATPTAIDERDGPVPVTCAPASGSTFRFGTTTVSCDASDTAGNTATASFSVLVHDTTSPAIHDVPGPTTVPAIGAVGVTVSYAQPTATDAVSGSVGVSCVPGSGSLFPVGATTVTCTARDAFGNQSSAGFVVTVLPPPQRRLSGSGYTFPETPTYRATFSVDVSGPLSPSGSVQYVYTRTRMTFVSTSITGFGSNGSSAGIQGRGTVNGVSGYTFSAAAVDGSPDTFAITIFAPNGTVFFSKGSTVAGGALTISP